MGSDMASRLQTVGDVFNLPAYIVGFLGILFAFTVVAIRGVPPGHTMAGLIICSLFLYIGLYTGMVLPVWIAIIGLICVFFITWSLVITRS